MNDEDYERLLAEKNVKDICAYLKTTDGYGEVLSGMDEREVHRGQLELLLEREIVDEYVRLYNFMDNSKRAVMKFWFMRREVEFLKREIRHIYTHEERSEDEINQGKFDAFFKTHTKINGEVMHNASTLADCIIACKGTPYAQVLERAESVGADLFSMSMMLDMYYYKSIWHTASQMLDKKQFTLFKRLIGTKIDMLNLMWIYRGKKYFKFGNEIIFTYLLPVRYRLSEDVTKQLVTTPSADAFVDAVGALSGYADLFTDCDKGKFPESNYRRIYNKLSKTVFASYPDSMVAVYAYLNLREVEIDNITTVIEGIRYNLNSDFIRTHIGID